MEAAPPTERRIFCFRRLVTSCACSPARSCKSPRENNTVAHKNKHGRTTPRREDAPRARAPGVRGARRRDEQAHARAAAREDHASGGEFVKSVAFGGLDGIITTFAIVCTVAGAGKPPGYVLLFGVANLVADALSMGVGDFLSTKSEIDFSRVERARASAGSSENHALGEIEEMIAIYEQKGPGADARQIIETMAKNVAFFPRATCARRATSPAAAKHQRHSVRVCLPTVLTLPCPSSADVHRRARAAAASDDDERDALKNGVVTFGAFIAPSRAAAPVRCVPRAGASTCSPRRSSPARAPSSSWLSSGSA